MSHTPTPKLTEYTSKPPESSSSSLDNGLFLERLDTFLQKSLGDIKAFAERESKSYEEVDRIFVLKCDTDLTFDKGRVLFPVALLFLDKTIHC